MDSVNFFLMTYQLISIFLLEESIFYLYHSFPGWDNSFGLKKFVSSISGPLAYSQALWICVKYSSIRK